MNNEVSDLRGAMGWFFNGLPSYKLWGGEEAELVWESHGDSQTAHKERFPDVERAAAKAATLSPNHEVSLWAVSQHTLPKGKNGKQILAYWHPRHRQPEDRWTGYDGTAVTTEMVPLVINEPSQAWAQHYPSGNVTCDAVWFFYRSRCIDEAS